ncbi:hypothetical protein BH24CHL4_BH24CHL4_14220 [soil metagenome]
MCVRLAHYREVSSSAISNGWNQFIALETLSRELQVICCRIRVFESFQLLPRIDLQSAPSERLASFDSVRIRRVPFRLPPISKLSQCLAETRALKAGESRRFFEANLACRWEPGSVPEALQSRGRAQHFCSGSKARTHSGSSCYFRFAFRWQLSDPGSHSQIRMCPVCAGRNDFGCGLSMSREMHLILDGREKLPGDVEVGVVVDAGRENVKHFLPESLLAGPDVSDSLKKLFEAVASSGPLEKIIIHREVLD